MDPYLPVPIPTRVRRLRRACRYSKGKFARILGTSSSIVAAIEGWHHRRTAPTHWSGLLPRLRLMEAAFRRQLEAEIRHPSQWGRDVRVYRPYNGNVYTTRMHPACRSSTILPDDPKYIEALGGIEVFRLSRPARRRLDME